jgi:pseudouridine-5'-phosphate glycosidase
VAESEINRAVGKALKDAEREGIKGKAVTPYLLAAVRRETEGKSLDLNVSLLNNNAAVAAKIAAAL